MKKILKFVIVMLLCFPMFILADCGIAGYDGLYGVVTNKDGIKDGDTFIPYGEVLKIYDIWYDHYYFDWNGYSELSANKQDIELKDLDKFAKDLGIKFLKEAEKEEYYTIAETELRSGPGNFYDKINTIPANKDINYYYLEQTSSNWAYIEYNGTYGWAKKCHCRVSDEEIITIGKKSNEEIVFYGDKLTATKNSYTGKKVTLDVVSGTKFNAITYLNCEHSQFYCYTYKDELYCSEVGPGHFNDDTNFYGDSIYVQETDLSNPISFDIANTKLYSIPVFVDEYLTDVKLEKEENIAKYKWYDYNVGVVGIEQNGTVYWIDSSDNPDDYIEENTNNDDQKIDDIPNENNVIEDTEEKVTPKMETKQILIFMSVFAVVVLIVIILLNRNKKPNQEKIDLVDDSSSDQEKENESKEEKNDTSEQEKN